MSYVKLGAQSRTDLWIDIYKTGKEMINRNHAAICSVVLFGLFGCGINTPTINDPVVQQPPAQGYKPFASFRDADAPGTVIRVSPEGDIRRVTLLDVTVLEATEVTNDISAKRVISAKQFLDILAGQSSCAPVSANFNPSLTGEVSIKSISGKQEYVMDEAMDPAIRQLKQRFASNELTYHESDQYWIIRETLKTAEIDYSTRQGWLVEAHAKASLDACVNASVSGSVGTDFRWDSGNNVSLKRTFDVPLRGWYRADPLNIDVPNGAGPGTPPEIKIMTTDYSEQPDL